MIKKIQIIENKINLRRQFLVILKDGNIIFSNETDEQTKFILDEAFKKYKNYEKTSANRINQWDHGDNDRFIMLYELLEKQKSSYKIFTGVYEEYVDYHFENVVFIIIALNTTIFLILLVLVYVLINKTIKPLKLILEELNELQKGNDLSKRLKEIQTKDEFEEIINSFNDLLSNIENSVENIKQFSSDASHELRTPLTIIQGEIELLKEQNFGQENLERIDKEQKRLQDIIKNFLLLSRLDKEALKSKKTSLDKVILETIEMHLDKIENKNLELILDIEEGLVINFDERYLNIVINNILSNAIKYTKEGFIKIESKKTKDYIFLNISDSGIGIEKKDLNKIFERFFRVDKVRTSTKEGIGLGLSIVKKICEQFESIIDVESRINKGTSFKVYFKKYNKD